MVSSFRKRAAGVENYRKSLSTNIPLLRPQQSLHPPQPEQGSPWVAGYKGIMPTLSPPWENERNINDCTHLPLRWLLFKGTSRGSFGPLSIRNPVQFKMLTPLAQIQCLLGLWTEETIQGIKGYSHQPFSHVWPLPCVFPRRNIQIMALPSCPLWSRTRIEGRGSQSLQTM